MGYWSKLAARIDKPPSVDHEWAVLLKKTLAQVDPEKLEELTADGDLDAYLIVSTHEAIGFHKELLNAGTPEPLATETVLEDMLPAEDEDIAEDWELDGAAEDEAAEFGDWLG